MITCSVLKSTDRAELYEILSFLNEKIPYNCEVCNDIIIIFFLLNKTLYTVPINHKRLYCNAALTYFKQVHSIVLAALQTRNPCYSIYYLLNNSDVATSSGSSDKEYLAIVGVKKEHALDSKTKNRVGLYYTKNQLSSQEAVITF